MLPKSEPSGTVQVARKNRWNAAGLHSIAREDTRTSPTKTAGRLHQKESHQVTRGTCTRQVSPYNIGVMLVPAHSVSRLAGLRHGVPTAPCHRCCPLETSQSPRRRACTSGEHMRGCRCAQQGCHQRPSTSTTGPCAAPTRPHRPASQSPEKDLDDRELRLHIVRVHPGQAPSSLRPLEALQDGRSEATSASHFCRLRSVELLPPQPPRETGPRRETQDPTRSPSVSGHTPSSSFAFARLVSDQQPCPHDASGQLPSLRPEDADLPSELPWKNRSSLHQPGCVAPSPSFHQRIRNRHQRPRVLLSSGLPPPSSTTAALGNGLRDANNDTHDPDVITAERQLRRAIHGDAAWRPAHWATFPTCGMHTLDTLMQHGARENWISLELHQVP